MATYSTTIPAQVWQFFGHNNGIMARCADLNYFIPLSLSLLFRPSGLYIFFCQIQ